MSKKKQSSAHPFSPESLRSFRRALLYSALLIIPPMIPFFFLGLYKGARHVTGQDVPVTITRNAIAEDYDQFRPHRIFRIGMYINDLSSINVADRSFHSRFTFWARNFFDNSKNYRSKIVPDAFSIVDDISVSIDQKAVRWIDGEEPYVQYAAFGANGEIANDYDLTAYPFDHHKLRFVYEPKDMTAEEVILSVDANSALAGNVAPGEWDIASFTGRSEVHAAQSDFSDPKRIAQGSLWTFVPRVVFEVEITRRILGHLLKTLLPLLIILIMAYTNFYVDPSELASRIEVAFTSFLSIAALHWAASGEAVRVAYLTAMDQFFLIGYSLVLLVIVETVLSKTLVRKEGTDRKVLHHPMFKYGLPVIRVLYPVVLIGGWYWIAWRAMTI